MPGLATPCLALLALTGATAAGLSPANQPEPPAGDAAPGLTIQVHPEPIDITAIETADDLLVALETADADLESLTTDVRWAQFFALAGDMKVRTGTIAYRATPGTEGQPPRRAFAITFTEKWVGDRIAPPERIDYIFDGEWFLERIWSDHQAFKRQVVPPGRVADPLRIGEGPFPIPVGQRREEILSRFEAELVDPIESIDDRLVSFVEGGEGTWCLSLTPHPHLLEDTTWRRIRVWYSKADLTPILAWTINAAEDESYIQLINVERGAEVEDAAFRTSVDDDEEWDVFITPWQESAGGGGQ